MKKYLLFVISIFSFVTMSGCNNKKDNNDNQVIQSGDKELTIYNSEDYIDETLIKEFEKEYGVKVNYYTFDTNETLYNQFTLQKEGTYDLICPSEYMIQRMVSEDLLIPLKKDKLETYYQYGAKNIVDKLNNMPTTKTDEAGNPLSLGDYASGYMWGTMGLIYDPEAVDEEDIKSWDILWDKDYYKKASVKNSMRDTYVVGILHAYRDELRVARNEFKEGKITSKEYNDVVQKIFNYHDEENVQKVKEELISLKSNIYGFEVDSGKNDIITGKIKMNLAWSGDAVYSIATAAEEANKVLKYSVPEEGSNIWYDGWVLPKGANEDLAYKFINFLCDPINAAINMNYIGYTSFTASEEVFDQVATWYGGEEFFEGTTYYPANEEEETDASIVYYEDNFYQCIKESLNNLPTNEEFFELLSEEDSPLKEPVDLSYYFQGNLQEGKKAIVYPFEACANQLETQYPTTEIVERCAFMNDFGEDNANVIIMWGQIKASTNMMPYYFILLIALLAIPAYYIIHIVNEHNEKKYAIKRSEQN